jgi:hypothetical protein
VLTPTDRADVAALIAQRAPAQSPCQRVGRHRDAAGVCVRDPLFASVADCERRLMGARSDVAPGIDPTAWFRAMTGKLERLTPWSYGNSTD